MSNISKTLYRLPKQGKLSGVCAGLAEYFNFDVTIMRLIFVLLAFITNGMAILIYIILAVILPTSDYVVGDVDTKDDGDTIGEKVQRLGKDLRDNGAVTRARNYFGIFLLILGTWLLLGQFLPQLFAVRWNLIWPALLIFVGLLIIIRKRD